MYMSVSQTPLLIDENQNHPEMEQSSAAACPTIGGSGDVKDRTKFGNINMECQETSPVVLTGTAKAGKAGPPLGSVDIGRSESAYLFRVGLPGVRRNGSNVRCNIRTDGRVYIEGLVGDAKLLMDMSSYEMKVEQLCPRGPFTVTFNLPGPVEPRLCSCSFRPDGILEVVVKAKKP